MAKGGKRMKKWCAWEKLNSPVKPLKKAKGNRQIVRTILTTPMGNRR